MTVPELLIDPETTHAPRNVEERFRLYAREGGELVLLATTGTPQGVGLAIITLAEDRREAGIVDAPVIGVLDGMRGRWLAGLWPSREETGT